MIVDWKNRPVITVTEAVMILGLSTQTIKRRIESRQLTSVHRDNKKQRILIHTDSILKYLKRERKDVSK